MRLHPARSLVWQACSGSVIVSPMWGHLICPMSADTRTAIEGAFRDSYGPVLAALSRRLRDIDLAEVAKTKIRDAGIPFEVPARGDIGQRLDAVLSVFYLILNEGYFASSAKPSSVKSWPSQANRVLASARADSESMLNQDRPSSPHSLHSFGATARNDTRSSKVWIDPPATASSTAATAMLCG
jgi:hypothetical protein